jgi:hypothetical protein
VVPKNIIEAYYNTNLLGIITVWARPGRLSALSRFHSKAVLYGAFVWARRALTAKNGGTRPAQFAVALGKAANALPVDPKTGKKQVRLGDTQPLRYTAPKCARPTSADSTLLWGVDARHSFDGREPNVWRASRSTARGVPRGRSSSSSPLPVRTWPAQAHTPAPPPPGGGGGGLRWRAAA